MATNALYYPYIHIRDIEWLKGTLLLFSQVRRMLPGGGFTPADREEVLPFIQAYANGRSLVCSADLFSERCQSAQRKLAERLLRDAKDPEFVRAHGFYEARKGLTAVDFGFQIHQQKLIPALRNALKDSRLAWKPGMPEPYDEYIEYIELHPRVGEAVMSTLAMCPG